MQNLCFEGSKKVSKIIKNGSQNGPQKSPKWSHWRPKGGQGATLSPPLVDLEGPENRSIFEGPLGRQKVDGCSPWAARGGKMAPRRFDESSAAARQRLGGGTLFEKRVPRASSRARLINKLIKFKQFLIFKIFNNLQNIQKDQKIRIFVMMSQRRWPVAWRICLCISSLVIFGFRNCADGTMARVGPRQVPTGCHFDTG